MRQSLSFPLQLHDTLLVLVRALVEDERDGRVPGGFQHLVPQALLVKTVVPLRKVTGAVGVVRRGPNLPAVHTAATAKPNTATRGRERGGFSTNVVTNNKQALGVGTKCRQWTQEDSQLLLTGNVC